MIQSVGSLVNEELSRASAGAGLFLLLLLVTLAVRRQDVPLPEHLHNTSQHVMAKKTVSEGLILQLSMYAFVDDVVDRPEFEN